MTPRYVIADVPKTNTMRMSNCTERPWPFKKLLRESDIIELLPNLSPDVKVAVLFQFSTCQMVINSTVDLLDIDHFVSRYEDRTIRWQVLSKDITPDQIQKVTNSIVVRVCA
jgi:hypothetical protein